MNRLMIGGGAKTKNYQRQGWIVLDGCSNYDADIVSILPPLPHKVYSIKWDVIKAVHFIEHLYLADAAILLKEIYKVLVNDGRLILEQANFEKVMRFALGDIRTPVEKYPWMEGDPSWFGMRSIYPQKDMKLDNDLNSHLWGYTPKTLTDLVESCGWNRDKIKTMGTRSHVVERDFRLEARR